MSRLDELIAKYCPEGVEYKPIAEIATDIFRGAGIKREDVTEDGVPCVRYGEIYTTYGIWFDECVSHTTLDKVQSPKYFEHGDILFVITGESVEDIAKSTAYVGHDRCLAGGDIVVLKHNQDPKYLSYALSTADARKQKSAGKIKSKVVHSNVPSISSIVIPVPPIEVQREIVRILDEYNERTSALAEALTAELNARQIQYKHYAVKVFDQVRDEAEMVPLSSLGRWTGGKTPSMAKKEFWQDGTIPWISSKDMKASVLADTEDHITERAVLEAPMTLLPASCIAIVTRSGILKHTLPVAFVPFETTVNQDIKALCVNETVMPRYAFLAMKAFAEDIRVKTKKQGGTVDSLEFPKVLAYEIPLPSLERQREVVAILDRFDAICNDLTSGLPAEIAARQKQYEYFRDKLLTFKPAV